MLGTQKKAPPERGYPQNCVLDHRGLRTGSVVHDANQPEPPPSKERGIIQHADKGKSLLLGINGERPRGCGAAEQGDKLAAPHESTLILWRPCASSGRALAPPQRAATQSLY